MSVLQSALAVVAVIALFLILVVPHEGGHFLFSKLFGVRVIEFSVGMGTKLWSRAAGGTLYALRLLPIGGYVRLGGMEPGDYEDPNGFHRKRVWQRLAVLLAGPMANFLVAAVVWTGFELLAFQDPGRVITVIAGSPAAEAGIKAGDRIIQVDGIPVRGQDDIRKQESDKAGQALDFTVQKQDGKIVHYSVAPRYDPTQKKYPYLIGISSPPFKTPSEAVADGAQFPFQMAVNLGGGIYELATGRIPGGVFGAQGVTGPIGITAITYQQASHGVTDYMQLVAAISVALGLANLLPIPALDGGRMLVVVIEAVRRSPFDRDRELAVQRAGLVALLTLFVVVAFFDIRRLISGEFFGLH